MNKNSSIHILLLVLLAFTSYSQSYTLNGDASYLGGDCYQLTPEAQDKYGTVWYSDQLDLTQPFDISFRVYLGTDDNGADGVVFVLQTVGNNAIGISGDGMGYSGFSPSLGVEFDTYDNTWNPQANEISADHIAISRDGDIANPFAGPIQAGIAAFPDIENGVERPVRITWDPISQLIKVYFDCELRISTNYDIINSIFGGNPVVYWGFTGATDGAFNEQRVCIETNVLTVPDTVYICEGNTATLDATGSATNSYTWTPNYNISGANTQQPTVWPTQDTTYYVSYTDYCGLTRKDSIRIIVNINPQPDLGNDTVLCPGNNLVLDAGAYTDYIWSGGETMQTISVNSASTYSVSVTDNKECTGSDDIVVTMGNPPDVDAGNNTQICVGGSVNLTANSTSAVNYEWVTGESTQSITVSPATTTTYSVTVTDANACENSDNVTITVASSLLVDLGNDTAICAGSDINITANGGIVYNWSTGETTQVINVNTSGNYSVTVSDGTTCTGTDDINITVNPLPNINAGNDENICIGDNITLTATGGTIYSWSTGNNTQSITVSPTTQTQYTVTGTDINGCINSDDVVVNVNPLPNADAGQNQEVCDGESVTLTASGGTNYQWSTNENTMSINVNPANTTLYTVTVTDANGCKNTDDVLVTVHPPLQLEIQHSPSAVCPGENVILTTNITGGGSPPYLTTLDDGTVISPPLTIIPEDTTFITINVKSFSCPEIVTATEMIPVFHVPEPNFTSSVTSGCEPLMVSFNSLNDESGLQYHWNFGNYGSNFSSEKNPIQIYDTEGSYDISLQLTTEEGCTKSAVVNQMITVYPKPYAKFIVEPMVISSINSEVQFTNLSSAAYENIWYFGDDDTSNVTNPFHTYEIDEAGEYKVTLIAQTKYGCTDTSRNTIKVQDIATLYVPTAFSPDGDGINDIFNIQANGVDLDSYTMWIYNRWGEIIFKTTDIYSGWDGRVKENKIAEPGIYTWRIVYKEISGIEYSKTGVVTVIR